MRASTFLGLLVAATALSQQVPSSSPHAYPGIPNNYVNFANSAAWQKYYLVKDPMPNVTFPLQRSFAGSVPVNRPGHPNNTLFFYAFEKSNGSLTNQRDLTSPWIIWLNGGPGSSSLAGLFFENGPIRINGDGSASLNNFSWNNAADTVWLDQPVGAGFSTADALGYAVDEDQVGTDFIAFLRNFVQIFPSLKSRPLYIVGESYAGKYIPYMMKTYFGTRNPPVHIAKFAIGDGTIGASEVYRLSTTINTLETHPQLINYDPVIFNYFREQAHLCHLDVNFSYPQPIPIPSIVLGDIDEDSALLSNENSLAKILTTKMKAKSNPIPPKERERLRHDWKRDLTGRPNGTIDPWYGCDLFDEILDYALNFTFPWTNGDINVYNIPDALNPEVPLDATGFLNNPQVRSAIHAPIDKDWNIFFDPTYPFGNSFDNGDPSPPPILFLSELATNISANNMSWILYSGNNDSLDGHRGTEITIQNTTFGGIRGFTKKPSTPWTDDSGNFAGIVHQERGLTYLLFAHAGHQVPLFAPKTALTFLRKFVLGNNATGRVIKTPAGTTAVIGGEDPSLGSGVLAGDRDPIFYGSGATQFSTVWPSATIAAWESFIATVTAVPHGH